MICVFQAHPGHSSLLTPPDNGCKFATEKPLLWEKRMEIRLSFPTVHAELRLFWMQMTDEHRAPSLSPDFSLKGNASLHGQVQKEEINGASRQLSAGRGCLFPT